MFKSRSVAALFLRVLVSACPEAKIYLASDLVSDLHGRLQTTGHFTAHCGAIPRLQQNTFKSTQPGHKLSPLILHIGCVEILSCHCFYIPTTETMQSTTTVLQLLLSNWQKTHTSKSLSSLKVHMAAFFLSWLVYHCKCEALSNLSLSLFLLSLTAFVWK